MQPESKQLRILHLEDQPTDAELIESELREAGLDFEYLCVNNARDFYAALADYRPQVILCDYKLPDFDGLSALKHVQQNHPEIPVIMVTGTLSDVKAVELLKTGAKDYLLKNSLTRLPSAIRRVLEDEADIQARKAAEQSLHESALRLQHSLDGTVKAMAAVVEMRDPYTAGHQRRVSELSKAIAQEMGLSVDETHGIYLAGVIHDLGKIHVPAEILSKPGYLDDIEMQLVRTHCQVSYDILKDIEFPWPIAAMVYQHHERVNGSGYPNGLKSDEILLGAKILAVADTVEAISSHRPYRASIGLQAALEEVAQQSGILYDEAVVAACLRLFRELNYQLPV